MKTRGNFPYIMAITGAMFLISGMALFGADATDQALDRIKTSANEAIAEVKALTTQSAKIRSVNDAVDALERFYTIVQRMNESCAKILQDLGAEIDTKKLSVGIAGIQEQTRAAGMAFALVIGKLPQDVLSSDAFKSVLQKINTELAELQKDMEEE